MIAADIKNAIELQFARTPKLIQPTDLVMLPKDDRNLQMQESEAVRLQQILDEAIQQEEDERKRQHTDNSHDAGS